MPDSVQPVEKTMPFDFVMLLLAADASQYAKCLNLWVKWNRREVLVNKWFMSWGYYWRFHWFVEIA